MWGMLWCMELVGSEGCMSMCVVWGLWGVCSVSCVGPVELESAVENNRKCSLLLAMRR